MIEITKENINSAKFVDKEYADSGKTAFIKKIFNEGKFIMYLFGAFAIFTIANVTLIYSFFKILAKL